MKHSSVLALISLALFSPTAQAQSVMNNTDIVWIAVCSTLVFIMQAGFALLEGGNTRAKNAVNVILKNYVDFCVGVLAFWFIGYGLMFGPNPSGWIGLGSPMPALDAGHEAIVFVFQAMFVATAATIVSGAVAERMRFMPYVIGSLVISVLIYPVFGSWAWGGAGVDAGWLKQLGFIDHAGSTVVHSVGGWCALAAVLIVGPRTGRFARDGQARRIPGHNLPMVALGVFILWFGWFGFNGGSALLADESIGRVLLNTQLAAAAGVIVSMLTLRSIGAPVFMATVINGGLGGLVAITAGCNSMTPGFAILTGAVGGVVVATGSRLLLRLRIDDVVDAVPVHAFCGVWGTLAAGLFYAPDMFNVQRVMVQAIGCAAAALWVMPVAGIAYYLLKVTVGLRVSSQDEQRGLDYAEHDEFGYPEFMVEMTNREWRDGQPHSLGGVAHVPSGR